MTCEEPTTPDLAELTRLLIEGGPDASRSRGVLEAGMRFFAPAAVSQEAGMRDGKPDRCFVRSSRAAALEAVGPAE